MAKKKSVVKKVVETVEGWVGMGSKAAKKKTAKSATIAQKNVKKKAAKKKSK